MIKAAGNQVPVHPEPPPWAPMPLFQYFLRVPLSARLGVRLE